LILIKLLTFIKHQHWTPRQRSVPHPLRKIRQNIAARLMATGWFARHVVIDRWFLHAGQPAFQTRGPS
jgi:hypothetical protein